MAESLAGSPEPPNRRGEADRKQSLGRTTASGIMWLLVQTAGSRAVGLLGQLFIGSLLLPSDFGRIGLAYTVSTMGGALVDVGIDQVLVQRQRTLRVWIVPAFYLSLVLGLAGAMILLISAPIGSFIYKTPDLTGLVSIMALAVPLSALSTVPMALLRASFSFRFIALIGFSEVVLTQTLTCACALAGFGVYSFVVPAPLVAAIRTTALWLHTKPRLHRRWMFPRWKYLFSNSAAIFGARLVSTAIGQGDYFTLGLLGSSAAVGNYFFAFRLASQPLYMLAGNLSSVLFPALSQLRSNARWQGEAAFRASKLLGLIVMPFAFLQAAVTAPAMHLLFQDKWNGAIPLVQILSVALGFDAISWVAGTLLVARRRVGRQLLYLSILAPFFFLFVTIGGWNGSAIGVAFGVALYYGVLQPIYSYVIFSANGISLWSVMGLYLSPAINATVAFGSSYGFLHMFVTNDLLFIVLTALMGLSIYLVLLALIDPTGYRELRTRLYDSLYKRARQVSI